MQAIITVAGAAHYNTSSENAKRQDIIKGLSIGNLLALVREPHNPVDTNAIRVVADDGTIGYVPKRVAAAIASDMDQGARLSAMVVKIHDPTKLYGIVNVDVEVIEYAD